MDSSFIEHSDSDSSDSWTILDNSVNGDEIPDLVELSGERHVIEHNEKDEDTDGISIISDSEHETLLPCQRNYKIATESRSHSKPETAQFMSLGQQVSNNVHDHETIRKADDFLGDNRQKNKTYVHRRNKRLSTVLNIVVLASVITAAGVAIGHMWAAKTDCTLNNTPGVNKILSRLYRLQEENAYLRSKLKEITALNSYQSSPSKAPIKQNKCRKVFEESLNNDDSEKLTSCVDGKIDSNDILLKSHMLQPPDKHDFIQDVKKIRNAYIQNRSWINEKTIKKLLQEKNREKNLKIESELYDNGKSGKHTRLPNILEHSDDNKVTGDIIGNAENKIIYSDTLISNVDKKNKWDIDKVINDKKNLKLGKLGVENNGKIRNSGINEIIAPNDDKKITNKLLEDNQSTTFISERESGKKEKNKNNNGSHRRTDEKKGGVLKKNYTEDFGRKDYKQINNNKGDLNVETNSFYEDFKKDNRFTEPRHKQERKKPNRFKSHKKDKKRNKYEQWEMKGGLMKDYDDISLVTTSSYDQTDAHSLKDFSVNFNNKIDCSTETLNSSDNAKCTDAEVKDGNHNVKSEQVMNWVDRRAVHRLEARKRLKEELFEDNPTTAGWYFKRMRKREQCRAKIDNTTYRKLAKGSKNYKTKY